MTTPSDAQPTTVRELTRHIQDEYPDLNTSYNACCEQLMVVGQPGKPEPPVALSEIIGSSDFEVQAQIVASRSRWLGVLNGADDGGEQ